MNYRRLIHMSLTFALCLALLPVQSVQAATYTVTTTADSGAGSLRWAIEQANANPGPDTIQFNIAGCGGVCTIQPTSVLPTITDDGTTIEGYSQPGASPATASDSATILIEIDGSLIAANTWGLAITSANNVVQGLSITDFGWDGIAIAYGSATGNVVAGNYLGIDPAGADEGNGHSGVFIGQGAQENLVGGDTPAERNVLSGNAWSGAEIHGSGTMSNTIAGNYIGFSTVITLSAPNTLYGVRIYGGAQHNTVGGDEEGERNVISGNDGDGVRIVGADTMSNTVAGNYIGTTLDGTTALANGSVGVRLYDGTQFNTVGPDNVISGNTWEGVYIMGPDTMSNTVTGNIIGADAEGTSALPNHYGVFISVFAQHNTIGPDNVISGNERHGVDLHGMETMTNTVDGNYIGTDVTGQAALANGESGVYLSVGAQYNTIGPDNVISGNDQHGVYISQESVDHNTIVSNTIGGAADGVTALGNVQYGVFIEDGPQYNLVMENVISANDYGVWIQGTDTLSNGVSANIIGMAADGVTVLGNTHDGIHFSSGAQSNDVIVNLIAYNGGDGVAVDTPTTFDNVIWLNSIHHNDGLGIDLTNGANHGIGAPVIHDFDLGTMTVSGAACSECSVQIFASPDDDGEGQRFLRAGEAGPAGDFDITIGGLPYPYLTATATNFDDNDGTSEFSEVFAAGIIYLPFVVR